jgi:hypothetical protein
MADDEWMAYRSDAVELGGDGPGLRALMTGKIRSRGRGDYREEEAIPASLWAEWTFLPTFKGPLSEKMRALCWLVPPGAEFNRVCRGFGEIRLLRADVERLASPSAIAPKPAKVTALKKDGLDVAVARALEKLFPEGRPAGRSRNELAVLLSKEMKLRTVPSVKTLDRALALAWAVAGPK